MLSKNMEFAVYITFLGSVRTIRIMPMLHWSENYGQGYTRHRVSYCSNHSRLDWSDEAVYTTTFLLEQEKL